VSAQTVARRYATALADVLLARGEALAVQEELAGWERMMESNPQLGEVFWNPAVPYEQKQKVLKQLLERTRVRQTTANFLQLLLKNQRLTELAEINQKLAQILDERAGVVGAEVISARPLPEAAKSSLQQKLLALTRRQVRLSFATDESLLGGMVTRIGSTVYDGSVKNQLEQLRVRLAGN
jgi:F-type H+-transporting ATPase subunit delta